MHFFFFIKYVRKPTHSDSNHTVTLLVVSHLQIATAADTHSRQSAPATATASDT